jgi:hypothetical protein
MAVFFMLVTKGSLRTSLCCVLPSFDNPKSEINAIKEDREEAELVLFSDG